MRQPRIVLPGYPHHVTIRGNNRRRLFSYPADFTRMLWDIGHALQAFDVLLGALVLMSNHVHLVLVPMFKEALSGFMKSFEQQYARYRNRRRDASGKLFEERYFSVPIRSEAQLALTLAYVELNPVRAGITDDPADYPWSTHGLHTGCALGTKVPARLWTPSDWYLELGPDAATRAVRYSAWVSECRARDLRPDQADELKAIEALSARAYNLRLERPNRTCAREGAAVYRPRDGGPASAV